MARGKPVYDAAVDGFSGNLPRTPLTNGSLRLSGGSADQGHHLHPLFRSDPRGGAGSGRIRQPRGDTSFCQRHLLLLAPPGAPEANGGGGHLELPGNLAVVQTGPGGEDQASAQRQLLRGGVLGKQGLKGLLLRRTQDEGSGAGTAGFDHR